MTSLTDYADKRIEAERKVIAEWLLSYQFASQEFAVLAVFVAAKIERGEYRTKQGAGE